MAQKNILNKVKTANGYDTLYPLTPYQIYTATAVTNSGATYQVTIPLPTSEMIVPILIRFTANTNAASGAKISVNSGTAVTIAGDVVGNVKSGDICVVVYNSSASTCRLINIENKTIIDQDNVGGTTTFGTNTITFAMSNGGSVVTTFNNDGSITETTSLNGQTRTKQITFNSDGSITEVIS